MRYYENGEYHDFNGLVWYWPEQDKIFMSSYFDAMFFSLCKVEWDKFELLGFL